MTPLEFLPLKEFNNRQKSLENEMKSLAITESMMSMKLESDDKKKRANQLKECGNKAFQRKKYVEAEKSYSEALEFQPGLRHLWTNRAICRNAMKKFEEAVSDCDSALNIDPKCTKSITQKGNAYLGLGLFDEAKICFEKLRTLGEEAEAEKYLKKLQNIQVRFFQSKVKEDFFYLVSSSHQPSQDVKEKNQSEKKKMTLHSMQKPRNKRSLLSLFRIFVFG